MSEFDKEAERKKLREQFADDEDDRATTERMSELLLQGATMTNRHCDDCGDPVFRYDDQEFCPSCQHPVAQAGEATDQRADSHESGPTERAEPEPAPPEESRDGADDRPQPSVRRTDDGATSPTTDEAPGGSRPAAAGDEPGARSAQTPRGPGSGPAGGDDHPGLGPARAALERTVTRLAREAEQTDDPGRTRERLAAAREAAEALAALKRASR